MDVATNIDSVAAFVDEVLEGTGWTCRRVRARSSRLEPPDSYWSLFSVDINKDEERRNLRLVAKGALNDEAWDRLSERLIRHGADRRCDPVEGVGYPRLFPETRHAYWFYPYDPSMHLLPEANDPIRMASVLLGVEEPPDVIAASRRIGIERIRYMPEIGAILRYTLDAGDTPNVIFGKVQPGVRGRRTFHIVQDLWGAAQRHPGLLTLPRPLGFIDEMGLLLEEGIRGKPVGGNRDSAVFQGMSYAAAEATAVIHEARVGCDEEIRIEDELARLDRVCEQFKFVLPGGHFLLSDLITHMREHVRKTPEEERLSTHGDMKYDQFMFHNDHYTLLDFDYFAVAETSYDLGKFCAYAVPSMPDDWRQSVAAEEARLLFMRRYRELRPQATLQRFGIYEALQFALRAMSLMWAQTPGWERMAEAFLVMGFERLKSRLPE
jgi:Phosphotransferase enzyme family